MTEAEAEAEEAKAKAKARRRSAPAAESGEAQADEPARVLLHMPVDVRNLSMIVLASIATLWFLQWAREVIVPVLLGAMISYALTPVVDRLARLRVPRAAGAGLVLGAICGAMTWAGWALSDDATAFVDSLPQAAQQVRQKLAARPKRPGETLERVREAAAEIERAAAESSLGGETPAASGAASAASAAASSARPAPASTPKTPVGVQRVVVEKQSLNLREFFWTGTLGVIGLLGQAAIVLFIAFFLLASGDVFRRKLVRLAGPKLGQKKITIQALDEIHDQIQRFLLVQFGTSVLVGVFTGLAFFALDLDHSAVWGVVAGLTNLVPYVGAVFVGAVSTIAGFLQFGEIDRGLVVGAASFAIHTVVGQLLTPWLLGRTSRMNPFVVFVAVLFFGWLWGVVGLLLGVPILVVAKTICDRVDELKPVGEMLGA